MLRHLSIRDFVIVAALDLEFDGGFTVFSGETGAGKSILIDALALALGERADASVVRAGAAAPTSPPSSRRTTASRAGSTSTRSMPRTP
jgi:DNA repair ATPase RecN